MTQEDKELLLQDLCARVPYGVKAFFNSKYGGHNIELNCDAPLDFRQIEDIKPYLRPLSSMTEVEKEEFKKLTDCYDVTETGFGYVEGGTLEDYVSTLPFKLLGVVTKWLLSHHFDYMGLIEKGLAKVWH